VALVAALGLLALAAALLAGSAVASVELRRAARTRAAAVRARTEATRGLGEVVRGWDGALDSLAIGAACERALPPVSPDGPPVSARARVERLSSTVYAATISIRVGESGAVLATRRARLLLARSRDRADSSAVTPVTALGRWSIIELP
jgi:hypothetical protein